MDVMGWSNAAVVTRYAQVTAGLRGTSPAGSRCSCGRRMRLATHEADSKGSSVRGIAWSEVVVRGGVEPPTFRFSGGFAGPGESSAVRLTRQSAALTVSGFRGSHTCPQSSLAQR
jgi:hypothetical protein